jgi:hypothetical protein
MICRHPLVAEEENLPETQLGMGLDSPNSVEPGALEIELHHHARCLRESGVHANWSPDSICNPGSQQSHRSIPCNFRASKDTLIAEGASSAAG